MDFAGLDRRLPEILGMMRAPARGKRTVDAQKLGRRLSENFS